MRHCDSLGKLPSSVFRSLTAIHTMDFSSDQCLAGLLVRGQVSLVNHLPKQTFPKQAF